MMTGFSIAHRTRTPSPVPRGHFLRIKNHLLGKAYTLSLVCIGDTASRTLNKKHRKKDTPTNVLAFPISETVGEIFINIPLAKREAARFNHSPNEHTLYLFIHACLHLKGHTHGRRMEQEEGRLLKRFSTRR